MRGSGMELVLEADALGKRYGSSWALRDCSLRLPAGRAQAAGLTAEDVTALVATTMRATFPASLKEESA